MSYDDGQTWHHAPVTAHGDKHTVTVTHPAGAGYVSLRATAEDHRGNTVEQTMIHAYRYA